MALPCVGNLPPKIRNMGRCLKLKWWFISPHLCSKGTVWFGQMPGSHSRPQDGAGWARHWERVSWDGCAGHLPLRHDKEDAIARTPQGHQVNLPASWKTDCGDGVIFIHSHTPQWLADYCFLQSQLFLRIFKIKGSTIIIVSWIGTLADDLRNVF